MAQDRVDRLRTGVAYHGNRLLRHVEEDMRDAIDHGFNLIVHMLSHNDWDRHRTVMKEIVGITHGLGLEAWLDNWGLGGPPGDKSHFLAYYPGSLQVYNDGRMDPVRACLNSPDYRAFTKSWIELVAEIGVKTILWDEPHLVGTDVRDGLPTVWSCRCETCQSLFADRQGKPMPAAYTEEVAEFRLWSVESFFTEVTAHSAARGISNAVVVMLGAGFGISLSTIERVARIPTMDNVGTDPYWYGRDVEPYAYVYDATRKMLDVSTRLGKGHNLWIQGFGVPQGREEEMVLAADAAYDAGARTILVWGFRGSESNDYRASCPDLAWKLMGEAMRRLWDREWDARREVGRKALLP